MKSRTLWLLESVLADVLAPRAPAPTVSWWDWLILGTATAEDPQVEQLGLPPLPPDGGVPVKVEGSIVGSEPAINRELSCETGPAKMLGLDAAQTLLTALA